jgi:PAS domain S-box-containing protein
VSSDREEEQRLRVVALQNAQSILAARRRAEEELRQHSEWMRITLASIGDAVITTDADGRVTFMNAIAQDLTAWPQHEALGRALDEVLRIVHEETREPVENPAAAVLRSGSPVRLANHTMLISRSGAEHPISDSAAPIRDTAGNTVGAVLVFRDVSESKNAEMARAHLAAIIASSQDAIVSKTLDGIILSWNQGAERLFGYPASEAIGRPIAMLIPPDRQSEEDQILSRIRRGERIEHFETVRVTKDGRLVDISLTVSPILDAGSRIIGASKIARDITDRMRTERALREADHQKDRFIALLAHELRNPLAPLRHALQVMRLAKDDAEVMTRAREVMERQLGHMVRLIDDLLDISRIGQNKLELRRGRILLADVINSSVETARPVIDAAGHTLTVSLPDTPIHLDGDLTRLSQVFGNLLTNCAKYTERGGTIEVVAEGHAHEVVVSVRDNGIGIPRNALLTIFDMFSQVDRRIEHAAGGLGIGLALVKGLVSMHGGTVTASSDGPGLGSVFTVTLPTLDTPPSPTLNDRPTRSTAVFGPRHRVLVVDDNRDGADTMASMLELMGNDTRTAYDGSTAIRLADEFRPHLILIDIGMPDVDGCETTRRIRHEPWGQDVIIVALTGWGHENDRARSREAGCNHHLVKPLDFERLERLLAALPHA